jgi:hypothetical protein
VAAQETALPAHGATAHVRCMGSSFAPPADGRRELAATDSALAETMLHEDLVPRLQGRKTLASRPG